MPTLLESPKKIVLFIKSIFQELKLVEWLSRKKTIQYTSLVLISTTIIAFFLAITDRVFNTILSLIIRKL